MNPVSFILLCTCALNENAYTDPQPNGGKWWAPLVAQREESDLLLDPARRYGSAIICSGIRRLWGAQWIPSRNLWGTSYPLHQSFACFMIVNSGFPEFLRTQKDGVTGDCSTTLQTTRLPFFKAIQHQDVCIRAEGGSNSNAYEIIKMRDFSRCRNRNPAHGFKQEVYISKLCLQFMGRRRALLGSCG